METLPIKEPYSLGFFIKKKLKIVVRFLEERLPKAVFSSMWNALFPRYKSIVRFVYLVRGFVTYRFTDEASWQMVRMVHAVMPYSYVGSGGLEATYKLCKRAIAVGMQGEYVELGVARGGCAALMAATLFDQTRPAQAGRRLWLFDSYEGLPEPTKEDYCGVNGPAEATGDHVHSLHQGDCLGTLDQVKSLLLRTFKLPAERIVFVKGWFQDTVPHEKEKIGAIAVLRMDGDWYESTKTCLEGLYDQVLVGGAIIIDDYLSCYGCKRAVDEFVAKRNLSIELVFDGRGGCYFLKPA